MRGRIADFLYISPRRQRITIDLDGDFRKTFDKVKDADIEITVRKYNPQRSNNANAYMWVLIDLLSEALRMDKKEIYFDHLRRVGGNMETYCAIPAAADRLCSFWRSQGHTGWGWPYDRVDSKLDGCVNLRLYYGSSTFDTATMARMIDHLCQDCEACGIETKPQEEIKSLLEEYEKCQKSKCAKQ